MRKAVRLLAASAGLLGAGIGALPHFRNGRTWPLAPKLGLGGLPEIPLFMPDKMHIKAITLGDGNEKKKLTTLSRGG